MAAGEEAEEGQWEVRFREDEELEFYTELALHETERWITAVTKKSFAFPEDPRKSLENGILLCELLNIIKPGTVKRINKLPTPIAGLDNLHVFLKACRQHFALNDTQLFDPSDLEDLSQRAIADSEHLKEEVDRRLRNVAITVYWIGRVAAQTYQGPRIDESAFAALVHNQHRHREHIVSDGQLRRECSWESNSRSSAHGSHGGGTSRGSVRDSSETAHSPRHVRDSSFDSHVSYGKGSEDSIDESVFEVDESGMPIPRYSSSSALNHSREGATAAAHHRGGGGGEEHDSTHGMYSTDRHSGLYRSSPDLSGHGSLSKRRSSSTDSADGGGHSRQSSDSTEYPTRRYSTKSMSSRRTSTGDPLQFIKVKGATDLAHAAEEQIKLVKETKKMKITESISEDDSTDWKSNLDSWKNRRKSHSEKSYKLKEELEELEREKEPKVTSTQSIKTFSQMQEERERRKSAGVKPFYPIDDEGEDDIFAPASSEQQHSFPASRFSSRYQSSSTSREETKDTKVKSRTKEEVAQWARDSASEGEEEDKETRVNNSHSTSAPVPEPRASKLFRDTENSVPRQRRSGLPDYSTQDKRDSWLKQSSETSRDSALKENNRNSANNSLPSRSSGKISNILKSFEQKEEAAKSKPSVNSSVDVSARKKSFENIVSHSGDVDSYHSWSTDRDRGSVKSGSHAEMTSSSSSAVYASSRHSGKDYVEKTIKISQKPNSAKGFGFTLGGGADKKQPVVVEKVALGSAADVNELQAKDEVVSINGQDVARLTSAELSRKVQDSVRSGQIELRVKRFLGSGDDLEEDEDFLSTDEDVDTPDRSVSKSSSIRAENSFDSLDSRDGPQKAEEEPERPWIEEHIPPEVKPQSKRRGDPTSTSSDSGYDAQTFSPYHRGDNSSNEEELAPSQNLQTETQSRPSLAVRTRHLYPRDEDEDDYVNLPAVGQTTPAAAYRVENSDKGMGKEVPPSGEVEVASRPTITVRRTRVDQSSAQSSSSSSLLSSQKEAAAEGDVKPVVTAGYEVSASRREEKHHEQTTSEDSDSGPPAALRKWQRQRPRSEYTYESDEPPKFYDQMKISSRRNQEKLADETKEAEATTFYSKPSEDAESTVNNSTAPVVSSRRAFRTGEEKQRIRSWNQKQEVERQPAEEILAGQDENLVQMTFPYQQQRFTAEREQIDQQYQQDLQRAADTERQKQEEEKKLLEPELEKMRLLKERRDQRQARLLRYAQDLSADFAPPASSSSSSRTAAATQQQPAPSSEPGYRENQLSQQQQQQHTSTFTAHINSGQGTPAAQPEVLIIDPRNRGDPGEPVEVTQPGQPLQFQLKINSRETPQGLLIQPEVIPAQHSAPPPQDHAAFLEAERARIRQEELQRIEAERLKREEEERRHIRDKEEQLRQQEEMLRRQEEELRKTQERLEQERQQLKQQHMTSQKPQQPDYHSFSSHGAPDDSLQFETVTSKVRGSSPVYTSTIVAGPRRSEGRPQTALSYTDRNQNAGSYRDGNQDGYGVRRSEASWSSSRPQTASSWRGNVQTVSSSQGQLPKWPPAGEEHGRSTNAAPHGAGPGQYSREDMMAMNRKATPLQGKPPSPSPHDHHDTSSPVKREAPSKSQIHSLNSVPRARIRNPDQWMGEEVSGGGGGGEGRPQPAQARRSEANRSQFAGPQDHWLVQEAERRRMNDSGYRQGPSSRAQFSGPIKPVADNYGNRWREQGTAEVQRSPNMPAQIRQTLLQKTAGARGSTANSSSQEMNPQGPPYHPDPAGHSLSQTLPPNFGYGGGYSPSSRSDPLPPSQHQQPPAGDGGMNISGKQRCSHCNQELGFGAAMVIESLGLYYHTQCFKCCVCRTPLGSGVEGADVRVRVNKLHCPNCYSNDEAGLKFSKV
ncbi:uncharacterized protein LOC143283780 isoform X2 [Babylonia areolata]|uniref:uncharacterized protein LOC143283780 isoform X2 n=1 Tax=Babylonia areolata TaxID=304850 RepID=UPI003FCFEB99